MDGRGDKADNPANKSNLGITWFRLDVKTEVSIQELGSIPNISIPTFVGSVFIGFMLGEGFYWVRVFPFIKPWGFIHTGSPPYPVPHVIFKLMSFILLDIVITFLVWWCSRWGNATPPFLSHLLLIKI